MATNCKPTIWPAALVPAAAMLLAGCDLPDNRQVYHGANGEALAEIVREINAAHRAVVATSPALPRPPVLEALAAARRRGVQVDYVLCGSAAHPAVPAAEVLPILYDHTREAPSEERVFVIDERTVIRSRGGLSGSTASDADEKVLVLPDSPRVARLTAAECLRHAEHADR